MFNVGPAELLVIAIVVLLIFPPKQLPDIARTVGKFLREFRRQTDDVRSTIEREFYNMDQEFSLEKQAKALPAQAAKPGVTTAGTVVPNEVAPPTADEGALHAGEMPPESPGAEPNSVRTNGASAGAEAVTAASDAVPTLDENALHEGELPPDSSRPFPQPSPHPDSLPKGEGDSAISSGSKPKASA
jgi:sec-independent protein translocase protein TatB